MGFAKRVDRNHGEIVAALRQSGWFVVNLYLVGQGAPDILALKAGRCVLIEVKDGDKPPSGRRLTGLQEVFHAQCAAAGYPVTVVMSAEEAVRL